MALIKARSRGINLADNFAFTGTVSGDTGGTVLQYANATNGTQTGVTTSGVETANVQATLTPTNATTKIIAIYTVGGVASENFNRLECILRWGTSSSSTAGTIIANQYMANDAYAVNDMGTCAMTALIDHDTTSQIYVNGTVKTHDTNGQRYFNTYGSDSAITLLEVTA